MSVPPGEGLGSDERESAQSLFCYNRGLCHWTAHFGAEVSINLRHSTYAFQKEMGYSLAVLDSLTSL